MAEKLLVKKDITSFSLDELKEYITGTGEKAFRAVQVYEWIHKKLVYSFDEMSNIPKSLRERLCNECFIESVRIAGKQVSKDGTAKFLMELPDGNKVESVLMKYRHGNSVCISTQAGCRMGCRFCASTVGGLIRNLAPSEMLGQVYCIQRATGERVSNVILMGIGEPLDNYDNVIRFIKMLSGSSGINISQRNITLSTCGLVENLIKLAGEGLAITVAVSLHAPYDSLRQKIMPVARKYSISGIMDACRYYIEKTGRRITFEYSIMDGINDGEENAIKLARLLKGLNCHVNLIPLNPVNGRMGSRPGTAGIQQFKLMLEKKHINVTIRREMGSDIDAACGQLRNKDKGGKLHESICEK
ncbi:MAG: 23S rRNA (adenine(2503)-C(2))-methyltransferase RlmN [Lachnospiraceae bacterium]|nr:23S rRNA (adenine(2503)-C(2))-methyltransferase RlmN [Lachnospiraceae bacterium]